MSLLGQYIGNQMSDNPDSFGNITQNYAQNRLQNGTTTSAPTMPSIQGQGNGYQFNPGQAGAPIQNSPAPTGPVAPMAAPAAQPMPMPQPQPQPSMNMPQPGQPQNIQAMAPAQPVAPGGPAVNGPNPGAMVAQGPQPTMTDVGANPTAQALANAQQPQPAPQPVVNPAPQPAPQANAQPAPAPSQWQNDMQAAQNNPTALFKIAGNENYTDEQRTAAAKRAYDISESQKAQKDAEKKINNAFQSGDQKQINSVMNDIRKDDASGSYVKAYLFHRLGLNELSANEQKKLGAGDKWEQATLGGQNYLVHRNGQGAIIGAHDANGVTQDDTTLAKLNAGGAPYGSHQYTYGSEVYKAPDGAMLRNRTNSITGASEWVDMKNNEVWHGEGQPIPQRIETQTEIAQNKANIGVNAAGNRAYNTAAGKFNFENQSNVPMHGGATNAGVVHPGATVAPAPQGQPQPAPQGNVQPTRPIASAAQPQPAPQPAVNPNEGLTPAQITERNKAQGKVATTAATQVANLGATQNTIDQADHALDLLESGKHNIGPMVGGTVQGKGPIAQAVGTQLETESARNTKAIMDTVRGIGGAASQAAIKGHLSNQELQFLTENKPTETSDPEYTRQWLIQARDKLARAANAAQGQVSMGGTNQTTIPTRAEKQGTTIPKATKRYNPSTGQVEDIK
jgi:hypothetical protein